MDAAGILLWFTVISIFVILFGSIAYLLSRDPGPTPPPDSTDPAVTPQVEPPLPTMFTYSCETNDDCQTGLTCDTTVGECKIPQNGLCNSAADCVFGTYCSGVCLPRSESPNLVTLTPGDPCPCGLIYSCVTDPTTPGSGKKVCLKNTGLSCSNDNECISNLCEGGYCAAGKPNGFDCATNEQCLSGNCSLGYCQPPGTITGEENSVCIPENDLTCTGDGLICSVGGTCVPSTNGLLFPCNSYIGCPSYFGCYFIPSPDSKGNFPTPGTSKGFKTCDPLDNNGIGCVCLFNTSTASAGPLPNWASPFGGCLTNYTNINGVCYAPENDPCDPNSPELNGGCVGTCAIKGNLYTLEIEFTAGTNGTDTGLGCYPLTGVVGGTSIQYSPINIPSTIPVAKLIGTTVGFSPPSEDDDECTSMDRGTDSVYIVSYQGKNITVPDNTSVLWKLDTQGNWNSVLTLVFNATLTDGTPISVKFTGADVTTYQNAELIAISGTIQGGPDDGKDIALKMSGSQLTPLISRNNGIPINESGNRPTFDDISVTDTQTSVSYPGVLLINTSNSNVHFNNSGDRFVDQSSKLSGNDKAGIQLNFGIKQTSSGSFVSFPLMSYTSTSSGSRYIRFTDSIDGNSTSTYSKITYPPSLYGLNVDSAITRNYSLSKVNPLIYKVQNGIFSSNLSSGAGNTLFTLSSGSVSAIPGYVPNDAKFLTTVSNIYVYSPNSCNS